MEAEYMAAFGAIQKLIWTKGVLSEMELHYVDPMILLMDSKSAMALAKNQPSKSFMYISILLQEGAGKIF